MSTRRSIAALLFVALIVVAPLFLWWFRWNDILPPTISCGNLTDQDCLEVASQIEWWMPSGVRPIHVDLASLDPPDDSGWHVRVDPFLGDPIEGTCHWGSADIDCSYDTD